METEQTSIHRYPGVKPFSENERHLFYGRSTDTKKLSQLISLEKMVLLYSKSGLGKSSLLNAGVLPLFEQEEQYTTIKIRFGARFEGSLSPVATSILKLPDTLTNAVLDKLGAGNDTLWLRMKALQYNSNNTPKTYILVFDQFEELFTYDKDDIKQFKRQLADLLFSKVPGYISQSITNRLKEDPSFLTNEALEFLYQQPSVKVVLSIRSDRLSLLNSLTDYLPDILKNYYELKPLDRNAAIDAIVKPAADESNTYLSPKFEYTKECIDHVLNYLTENDQKNIETFQLQTVCQFAENLAIENRLPYHENVKSLVVEPELLGDLQNIFCTHYDKLISNILPNKKQQAARLLIENKLIIDVNRVSLPDVVVLRERGIDKELVTYLHDTHHLLRSEPNTTGGISYELSHDTLVAPILKAKKEREDKEELTRLEDEKMVDLLRNREREDKKRTEIEKEKKRKTQRAITWIISAASFVAVVLAVFGIMMWQRANIETQKAQSITLAAFAREQLDKNPTMAIRLAELAWETSPTHPPALSVNRIISEAYYTSIESDRSYYKYDLNGHTDAVSSAVFSPDGKQIVTASYDKTAKMWDAATGKKIADLSGHTRYVYRAVFSPYGKQIVTASLDKTAKIWDAASGKKIADLTGHTSRVFSAVFSPDGKQIVTASFDQTAKIWDAATGEKIADLTGHTRPLYSAVFSPDGKQIVTASWDTTAKIWDAATGKIIAELIGHTDRVTSAVFSPDGKQIVTASFDKTAKIWDAATDKKIADLTGHTDAVGSAVFSPDGKQIVTASYDNTAKIWDAASGKKITDLTGHTNYVYSAVFSPDGKQIVTASDDMTAKIWLTPKGIMDWLSKQNIHKLKQKDLEELGIDFIDLKKFEK